MRAHVDIWASPDGDEHEVDVRAVLEAVRAVPGVVQADWFFTGDDMVAIVQADTDAAFEEALNGIGAIRDCSVSNVRLVRSV